MAYQFQSQGLRTLQQSGYTPPSNIASMFPSYIQADPNGNIKVPVKTQGTAPMVPITPTKDTTTFGGTAALPTQYDSTGKETGFVYGETPKSDVGILTQEQINPAPVSSQPFTVSTEGVTSNALGGGTTYSDLLAKRQQLEAQAQEALTNQLMTQYQGLAGVENARYSSSLEDVGLGRAGIAERQATLKNLAASVPAQVATKQLEYSQKDIENKLASTPNLQSVSTAADGSVIGVQLDPTTGLTKTINFGNPLMGTYGNTTGGSGTGLGNTPSMTGIPQIVQTYTQTTSDGIPYINMSKVAQANQNVVKLLAAQYGIPALEDEDVTKVRSIDVTSQNLDQMGKTADSILSSGLFGRIKGLTANKIEAMAQTNPEISSFQTYRDAAINAIQALAGGSGSGFRLNQSEIEVASSNLPIITDNKETAQMKLGIVKSFLNKWKNQMLPNQQSNTQAPGQTQPSVSGGTTGNPTTGWF
jgi:hypothetical protein